MANFALRFLQDAEHLGEGLVQGVANPVAKFGNELGALGQAVTGNLEGAQRTLNPGGGLLHQGGVLQGREAGTNQNPAIFAGPNAAQNIRAASEGLQLGFLQDAEHLGEGLVQGVANPVAKLGNEIGALGQAVTGNLEGAQRTLNPGGGLLHQGGVLQGREVGTNQNPAIFAGPNAAQNIRATASEGLQLGSLVAGPEVGAAAESADAGYAMNFLRGGVSNAAFGTATSGAQQLLDTGKIDTKQLGQGALIAGIIGGAGADVGQYKFLNKLSKADDAADIVKQLTPQVGEPVAREIAPAIAKTNDPNVIRNIIRDGVGNKIPGLTNLNEAGAIGGNVSPSLQEPTPETPPTSPTPVNPPASPGQGSGQLGLTHLYHGTSSDVNLENLTTGDVTGRGQQRGLIYASENPDIASRYAESRSGAIGQNQKVIDFNFGGKILDQNSPTYAEDLGNLINNPDFKNLSGRSRNQLTNIFPDGKPYGAFDGGVLDTNPELQKYLIDHGVDAVKIHHTPFGGSIPTDQSSQTVILNPDKILRARPVENAKPIFNTPYEKIKPEDVKPEDITTIDRVMSNTTGQSPEELAAQRINDSARRASGQTSKVTDMEGLRTLHDTLNEGGTIDEAINRYMELTGNGRGQAKLELNQLLDQSQSLQKGAVNAKLNPFNGSDEIPIPKTSLGDTERPILNAKATHNQVMRYGNPALSAVDQLNEHDLALMDQLRGNKPEDVINQAQDKDAFKSAINAVKTYTDFVQAKGSSALDQPLPYRQNYGGRLLFENTPENQANIEAALKAKGLSTQKGQAQLNGQGYLKGGFFKNYEEAAQYGVKRLHENFLQDLAQDVNQRARDLSQLTLAKGFDEAIPNKMKVGIIGSTPEGVYKQLLIPGGEKISLPASLADEINKRAPAPDANGFWQGYDTINSNLKNLKLAGGGFHSLNVAGSYIGQQLASGKAFTDPGAIGDMFKATFSKNFMDSELGRLNQSGKLLDADASGLKYGAGEVAADVKPEGKLANIPILKQMHEAIFNRQIPYMKLRSFEQLTEGLDRNNPEDLARMTSIAKELNQNYGGLNREIQGLTPRQFQVAARGFLATDYNEGQIKTLVDAFSKGGAEGKLARQVVFGKALLFGGLATAGAFAGGEFQGQKPQQVAIDILHKFVNPSFTIGGYKVATPATQISLLEKPLEQTVTGAQSGHPLQGVQNFANARLAAVPSEVLQLAGNKNFQGQPIYGTDSRGRPIPKGTTAADIAGTVLPIPLSNTVKTATGSESVLAGVANTAGLNVTPQYTPANASTAAQTYLQQLDASNAPKAQIDAATKFASLLGQGAKNKSKVLTQAETDIGKGDEAGAQAVIDKYNQQLFQKLKPWASKQNIAYVDNNMLQILQSAMINFGTANKYAAKDIQKNPTKYGQPITPLSNNLPVGPVGPATILAQ